MNCFGNKRRISRAGGGGLVRPALLPLLLLAGIAAGCSNHKLSAADAQRLIETNGRFTAPDVLTVRSRYCSTINAPSDNPASGLGRLKALEGTGAIRIEHRAAAPGECASTPGPMREWLIISIPDAATFHPRAIDNGASWEFTLAERRLVSLGDITFNTDDDPTIAHVPYRWALRAELLGQLMQTSEDPVNAQATFIRPDGTWQLRDVGF
jgi:hypothetical protein